jgi:hypothetical protein
MKQAAENGKPSTSASSGESPKQKVLRDLLDVVVHAEALTKDVDRVRAMLIGPLDAKRLQMALLACQLNAGGLMQRLAKMQITALGET